MSASSEQNRFASLSRRQIVGAGAALVAAPAVVAAAYAAPGRQDSTPAASPEATPGATPGATPDATPVAGGGETYEVSMIDLAFEPADFTIPADTDVTVTVINNGQLPHYWQVVDQGIESPEAAGGDTTPHDVIVNLPAGTYDVICPVPGHAQAGMVGVLTVE